MDKKPMLNAYPDSMGGTLGDIAEVLEFSEFSDVFGSFYILPSMFNTDLDRGFSVIDYNLDETLASGEDIGRIKALNIDLKLDFILNHASVLSPQFRDLIKNGQGSKYADFFINWNKFWENNGEMTTEGYIEPKNELIKDMFFRKAGLPILMVKMPNGEKVPYWNTFYQKVNYKKIDEQDLMRLVDIQYNSAVKLAKNIEQQLTEGIKPSELDLGKYHNEKIIDLIESDVKYLGQMDLNINSPLVWEFYEDTLKKFANYGAKVVRLDAFAYGSKVVGKKNFLNAPETWDILERVKILANKYSLTLLPEIHATYGEKIYETLSQKGYMTYDFFLPGLIIDAFESKNAENLVNWAEEITTKNIDVVNMLGCHDGIPLLDLKGIISEEKIENLIEIVVSRGGYVKNLHGQKNMYYQVNATYFSALGEDENKMLLARAIQLFMPGKPQIWYLDLFLGKNDYEGVKKAGKDGHKEINRTNLSMGDIKTMLKNEAVKKQLELIRFRNTNDVFTGDFSCEKTQNGMNLTWRKNAVECTLKVNLNDYSYSIDLS